MIRYRSRCVMTVLLCVGLVAIQSAVFAVIDPITASVAHSAASKRVDFEGWSNPKLVFV